MNYLRMCLGRLLKYMFTFLAISLCFPLYIDVMSRPDGSPCEQAVALSPGQSCFKSPPPTSNKHIISDPVISSTR